MRAITKRREPVSLTAHRQTPYCDYDNYKAKDDSSTHWSTSSAGCVATAWVASATDQQL